MNTKQEQSYWTVKKVLVATDFSASSKVALHFAAALARRWGAMLYVVHAIAPGSPVPEAMLRDLEGPIARAQMSMGEFLQNPCLEDLRYQVVLEAGDPVAVLQDAIREHGVHLAVLGTHGRQGWRKLVLRSVAEEITRTAQCPVLTIGPAVPPGGGTAGFTRVVCATGFWGHQPAVAYATALAHEYGARLTLLHAIDAVGRPAADQSSASAGAAIRRMPEAIPLRELMAHIPEFVVVFGAAADSILRAAASRHADLIVLGVRGTGAFGRAGAHLSHSTAGQIIALARCPVLTVEDDSQIHTAQPAA